MMPSIVSFNQQHDFRRDSFYVKSHTISELGDGQTIVSKGKAVEIPIFTSDLTVKMNLAVLPLLQDVNILLGICNPQVVNPLIEWSTHRIPFPKTVGINWLQAIKPLVDGSIPRSFIPTEVGICVLSGSWFDQVRRADTIKVLQDAAALAAIKNNEVQE